MAIAGAPTPTTTPRENQGTKRGRDQSQESADDRTFKIAHFSLNDKEFKDVSIERRSVAQQ